MKFTLSFTSNILQIKKDVNYMTVSQQKNRRSGLQHPADGGTAFKINPFLVVDMLLKLSVFIRFSCIH